MGFQKMLAVIFAGLLVVTAVACEREGPAERAGEQVDKTLEGAGERVEKTTE